MIPRDYITEWRKNAPWIQDYQVEQDLIMSRALVEIFSNYDVRSSLAFRGGTALYKLYVTRPARYSEDIDLVQIDAEPIGPTMEILRGLLDPWLGSPRWKQSADGVTLNYRFHSEDSPPFPLRLKIEINSREHFSVFGLTSVPFSVSSRWFSGATEIVTYQLDELLGTKLRALYQRKKGRDLFDLAMALELAPTDADRIVTTFTRYLEAGGNRVTRAVFERNLAAKLEDPQFAADLGPLLATGRSWDLRVAAQAVSMQLLARLPGEPWKKG